jgi:hypothetical protein
LAIEQIEQKLRGSRIPDKLIVQPRLLTRENIDAPEMRDVLTAHWWEGQ